MHIILGVLGMVITILTLINRLSEAGIDLARLNPFLWRRRRKWRVQLEGNPIYRIDNPLDLTALLATATVKTDGDMSSSEKQALLNLFQSEFNINNKGAADLLSSSTYLLGKGEEVQRNLKKVIQPSLEKFTPDQFESALQLLDKLSSIDAQGDAQGNAQGNELQRQFVDKVRAIFNPQFLPAEKWA